MSEYAHLIEDDEQVYNCSNFSSKSRNYTTSNFNHEISNLNNNISSISSNSNQSLEVRNETMRIVTHKKKFSCSIQKCGKKFMTKSGLELHTKTHFPSKFKLKCPDCNFTSFQKGNLSKHLSVVHSKDLNGSFLSPSFKCTHCSLSFISQQILNSHQLRKHTPPSARPFSCQLCEYKASEKEDLRKHIRINHTGERPYSCQFCDFKTHTSSTLSRHLLTHSNTQKYICELCSTCFKDRKRLLSHSMRHNGLKPYGCPHCTYATNRKDNLKTHVSKAHAELRREEEFEEEKSRSYENNLDTNMRDKRTELDIRRESNPFSVV